MVVVGVGVGAPQHPPEAKHKTRSQTRAGSGESALGCRQRRKRFEGVAIIAQPTRLGRSALSQHDGGSIWRLSVHERQLVSLSQAAQHTPTVPFAALTTNEVGRLARGPVVAPRTGAAQLLLAAPGPGCAPRAKAVTRAASMVA